MSLTQTDKNSFDGACNSVIIVTTRVPALKASYDDKIDKGSVTPMGTQGPGSTTLGTYAASDAKITFRSEDFRLLVLPMFPAVGAGNYEVPICVNKTHPELGSDSDLLLRCCIVGLSAAIENSNKADEVETTWKICGGIQWTDNRVKLYNDGQAGEASFSFGVSLSLGPLSLNF